MPGVTITLSPIIEAVIKRWSLEHADASGMEIAPAVFLRGHTFREWLEIPEEFGLWRYQDAWSTGYREVFVNHEERAIFTYCEGDLDLTVDMTDAAFEARLASAEDFYENRDSLGRKRGVA